MDNMDCESVLDPQRVQALENWLERTNVKLTRVHGQRKYGGPPEGWTGPYPEARCEVFISGIPRETYEDMLIPLFSSVGPLWEFRLMMNFSGQNRGFAFAKYGSQSVATDAIRLLHGHLLEPGCTLRVQRSTEKRRLCIDYLPVTTRLEELLQVLRGLTDGVERVCLMTQAGIMGVTAKVTFSSHHAASMAKKMLAEAFMREFSLAISVTWESMVKPGPDKPSGPRRPSQSSTLQNAPVEPPCRFRNCPRQSFVPPRLAHRHPSMPPVLCSRAMGGPPMGGPPMGGPPMGAPPMGAPPTGGPPTGGPTALHPHLPYSPPPYSQWQLVPAASPMMQLPEACEECEATVAGQPL